MNFPEEIIHYAWKMKLFSGKTLHTISGKNVEIISTGYHNTNSGPDFEQAKLRIDNTVWAGAVEMHVRSSDWYRHNHQADEAYQSVILHVAFEHDKEVSLADGSILETLIVKDLLPIDLIDRYERLISSLNKIPCEKHLSTVDDLYFKNWLSRIGIERLEQKTSEINRLLSDTKGSWDDAFYITLAKNFGFKVNSLPFEMLARSLPQQILAKHKNNLFQISALIYGQAGFLNGKFEDEYPQKLFDEYNFLKTKYSLTSIDRFAWKFMRMRPLNFPTVRLAQFAGLVFKSTHLFSVILEKETINEVVELFEDVSIDPYWDTHYRFDAAATFTKKQIGLSSVNNLIINTIIPFLFCYGRYFDKPKFEDRALKFLEQIAAENNNVTSSFKDLGVKVKTAGDSQALLQLKKNYCDHKKCLNCGIGIKIMNV